LSNAVLSNIGGGFWAQCHWYGSIFCHNPLLRCHKAVGMAEFWLSAVHHHNMIWQQPIWQGFGSPSWTTICHRRHWSNVKVLWL